MSPEVAEEIRRASVHLANAVASMTPDERHSDQGDDLIDLSQDVDRLWRSVDVEPPPDPPGSPDHSL